MNKRYKCVWHGRWGILEKGTPEYQIYDSVDGTVVEDCYSLSRAKYALKKWNSKDED